MQTYEVMVGLVQLHGHASIWSHVGTMQCVSLVRNHDELAGIIV